MECSGFLGAVGVVGVVGVGEIICVPGVEIVVVGEGGIVIWGGCRLIGGTEVEQCLLQMLYSFHFFFFCRAFSSAAFVALAAYSSVSEKTGEVSAAFGEWAFDKSQRR